MTPFHCLMLLKLVSSPCECICLCCITLTGQKQRKIIFSNRKLVASSLHCSVILSKTVWSKDLSSCPELSPANMNKILCAGLIILLPSVAVISIMSSDSTVEFVCVDRVPEVGNTFGPEDVSKVISEKLSERDVKILRPNWNLGPDKVAANLQIMGRPTVSDKEMELKLTFYFRQTWQDRRLALSENHLPSDVPLQLQFDTMDKIWIPDSHIINEDHSFMHTETVPNGFFRWFTNGTIYMSVGLTVFSSCPMQLASFPMDIQVCRLIIGSYGYTEDALIYEWDQKVSPVQFGLDARESSNQFKLVAFRVKTATQQLITGNYSRLVTEFLVYRYISRYIINFYLPSALVVVMALNAFWFPRGAGERTGLVSGCVIAIATLLLTTHSASVVVSYATWLDLYGLACFVLVLFILLETTLVGYVMRKAKKSKQTRAEGGENESNSDNGDNEDDSGCTGNDFITVQTATIIDKVSRIVFPTVFFFFNLICWGKYVKDVEDQKNDPTWTFVESIIEKKWYE